MSARPLPVKHQRFVDEYVVDGSAVKAYVRAGFSAKTAGTCGPRLLRKAHIAAAVAKKQLERTKRTEIDSDYVLTAIKSTVERCRQIEPVLDALGNPTGEYTFQAHPALKGLELLGKNLKLFTDVVEHKVGDGLADRLAQAMSHADRS